MSSAGRVPLASVVVMTMDRPDALSRCLSSLAAQTLPRERFQVIVVDVSRQPVERVVSEAAETLEVVHHTGQNLGVAGNRNTGARLARGRVLVFLDDDCVAQPDWLELLTSAVGSNPGSLAGGSVAHDAPATAYAAAGQAITEAVDAFFNPPGAEPRFLPGLNFAVERQRYLDLGGCDGRFGRLAAEDRDFVDRWRQSGGRLLSVTEASVRHEHRGSLRGFVRQYFNYGRGAWRYHSLRRHRRTGKMSQDVLLHLRLPRYFHKPLRRLEPWMRVKVVALLSVWQLSNLAGFAWQCLRETALARGQASGA